MSPSNRVRVAVIPARGGSTRVPRKNVRLLSGRPLVAWAVLTALAAQAVDRVVVSTDDDEIAEAALAAGAEVPFRRAPELSDDHTPLVPVIADAVARLGLDRDDAVCCVYPTAVGLLPEDLDAGAALLDASEASYVVGVVRYGHPVQRALAMDDAGLLGMVDPDLALVRTQDLPPRWHDAGQLVWGRAGAWADQVPVLTAARGLELPAWRTIDIDTEDDWARAELLRPLIAVERLGYPASDPEPADESEPKDPA